MLQRSKIIKSCKSWRSKAINRANEKRELKKTIKYYQERVGMLKAEIKTISKQVSESKKKL